MCPFQLGGRALLRWRGQTPDLDPSYTGNATKTPTSGRRIYLTLQLYFAIGILLCNMVTQPVPVDRSLTVHLEATVRQLTEYVARLLDDVETSHDDERAYAALLAESVRRAGGGTCWILRSAIHPDEQERILALTNPWLYEMRDKLERRARTRTGADGTSKTVAEWAFDDKELTRFMLQADQIDAETVRIDE